MTTIIVIVYHINEQHINSSYTTLIVSMNYYHINELLLMLYNYYHINELY